MTDETNNEIIIIPHGEEYVSVPTDADQDKKFAREHIQQLVTLGMTLASEAVMVAQQSNQSNAYIAAASVIKTIVDANKTLLDVNKVHKDISGTVKTSNESLPASTSNIQNNYFGTTADYIKMLKEKKKQENGS